MRWSCSFAAILPVVSLIAIACQKTPAEPAPVASSAAITLDKPHAETKPTRCVRPSPEVAPPAPSPLHAASCPPDPSPNLIPLAKSATLDPPDHSPLTVEIASTPDEEERGLMYRTSMPEDHGMLFRMPERKEHVFWMHNTCTALDMIFIDDDGFVVGIEENVPTLNDAERTVGCFSRWVLEVNAGWSRRHGLRAGQTIAIPRTL